MCHAIYTAKDCCAVESSGPMNKDGRCDGQPFILLINELLSLSLYIIRSSPLG